MMENAKWPKVLPPLSPEQEFISNDFMRYWLEILPHHYGITDRFNHGYIVKTAPKDFVRTLEIGAGNGEHLKYEKLTNLQKKNYIALDIRENIVQELVKQFPGITAIVGDCQKHIDFEDGHFDRILAIHVLEHLPNLPSAIREIYRLCDKERGVFQILIPCEGSIATLIAREISAKRIFQERYKQSYNWFIKREHINMPNEILHEIKSYFFIVSSTYFPIPLKMKFCNLFIGIILRPRREALDVD
jgi:SAM-dependent methyltransferase